MFKSLPSLSAQQVIKALKKAGFTELRQKGSHVVLYHPTSKHRVVIPVHKSRDIKKPLLKKIITVEAQMTVEEFLKLL